jgi:hypothetical protein
MYSTQTKFLLAFAVVALGAAGCDGGSRTTDGGRGDGGITLCGDGTCSAGETATSCPADCGSGPVCGNGTCEAGETNANCAADCRSTAMCGNGTCEAGETAANCASDCTTACADLATLDMCFNCYCDEDMAGCQAYNTVIVNNLLCGMTCGSAGAACADVCASGMGTPSMACIACANGIGDGNEDLNNAIMQCQADPACIRFAQLTQDCPM